MRENGNNDQYIREKRSEKCCYHELVAGTYQSIPAFIGKLMERGFNHTYIGSCLLFALLRTLSVVCCRWTGRISGLLKEGNMTQSKVLEQISGLLPQSHPPT